jgi:hypothetical protein
VLLCYNVLFEISSSCQKRYNLDHAADATVLVSPSSTGDAPPDTPGVGAIQQPHDRVFLSMCAPRWNNEDYICYTPSVGAWHHKDPGQTPTCDESTAIQCCKAVAAGQPLASSCSECNFVESADADSCDVMYRPPQGLEPCRSACPRLHQY